MDGRTEEYLMWKLKFRRREGSALRNETSTYRKTHLLHMWSLLAFNQEEFKTNFPWVWFLRRRWSSVRIRVPIREPIYFRASISLHWSYRGNSGREKMCYFVNSIWRLSVIRDCSIFHPSAHVKQVEPSFTRSKRDSNKVHCQPAQGARGDGA